MWTCESEEIKEYYSEVLEIKQYLSAIITFNDNGVPLTKI